MIYRKLIVRKRHIYIFMVDSQVRFSKEESLQRARARAATPSSQLHLSILQVSKAIRDEALGVFFRENRFNLSFKRGKGSTLGNVDTLFKKIGATDAALMRHVCWNESQVGVSAVAVETRMEVHVSKWSYDVYELISKNLSPGHCEIWCWRSPRRLGEMLRLPVDTVKALPRDLKDHLVPCTGMGSVCFVIGERGMAANGFSEHESHCPGGCDSDVAASDSESRD